MQDVPAVVWDRGGSGGIRSSRDFISFDIGIYRGDGRLFLILCVAWRSEEDGPVISVYITGPHRAARPQVEQGMVGLEVASLPFGATLRVNPGRGWRGGVAPYDPRLGGKGAPWARGAQCG